MAGTGLRRASAWCAAALLGSSLAGCGTISEETAGKLAYAPGKFELYSCTELQQRLSETNKKRIELEQLMAQAEQGTGGAFISAIAYRSDYAVALGEVAELKRMLNERQCAIGNKYSSGRAVF